MDWWQLAALIAAVVVPIAVALHKSGQSRSERNVKRLDDHIAEDVKAHERLAKLETKVDRLEVEVDGIRKRLHDSLDHLKRGLWDLFQDFKAEVLRLIGK